MSHYFQIVLTYIQNNLFSFCGKVLVSNGLPINQLNHLLPQMKVMFTRSLHVMVYISTPHRYGAYFVYN